jgi:hypothetical protein
MPRNYKRGYTEIENADGILGEVSIMPSTIETIDKAFFRWVDEALNIHVTTNSGWDKVPVLWVSAERAYQIKHDKELRDDAGVLRLPIITIERTSLVKDPNMKGVAWAHIPEYNDEKGGAVTVARRIKQDKTANFANADAARLKGGMSAQSVGTGQPTFPFDNKKIVYETISMPMPTYVVSNYDVYIQAEYQQQMNEMFTPFITKTGQINNFFIKEEGHKFEGFIQNDFAQNYNVKNLGEDERTYATTVGVKILGYLIGQGHNSERPKIVARENAVEVKIPREKVIMGDINEFVTSKYKPKGFYRE